MPIEFHCPHCDQFLKTPDDQGGVSATCPGCGEIVTIPDATRTETFDVEQQLDEVSLVDAPNSNEKPVETTSNNDQGSTSLKGCPMCGRKISVDTIECPHCGENFVEVDDQIPHAADIQGITTAAWEIYRSHFGLLFVSNLLQLIIHFCVVAAFYIVTFGVLFAVTQQPLNGRGGGAITSPQFIRGLSLAGPFLGAVLTIAVSYIDAGAKRLNLDAANGRDLQLGVLFTSGKFFLRIAGANLFFLVPQMIGALVNYFLPPLGSLIMLPAILMLTLFLWPTAFVIIDRDVGLWKSMGLARMIAFRNIGTSILLGILAFVLTFIGAVGCLVGLLFTLPLMHLNSAVAYCAMTGRRREFSTGDG